MITKLIQSNTYSMKKLKSTKPALLAMLLALAVILGWVEHMLPPLSSVPGIKPGFSNITVVIALYTVDKRSAALLAVAKALICSLLFGGISAMLYSLAGTMFSLCVMLSLYTVSSKYDRLKLSPIGVSAGGGCAHVTGQLLVAMLLTQTVSVWRMLPLLMLSGTASGILTGLLTALLLPRLKPVLSGLTK